MKHKKKTSKKTKIASAVTTLLGATTATQAIAQQAEWQHTITAFTYTEGDNRVNDSALQYQATRTTEDEKSLSLNVSIDSLTGSSPSGQVPADGSGGLVLSDLTDTRYSLGAGYSQRLNETVLGSIGLTASSENDYNHSGINFSFSKELNERNTTISLGLARSADTIDAESGNRTPGVSRSDAIMIGPQDKDITDIVLGVTQILSKTTIAQFNYSLSDASGYINDPYKVVSIVDSAGRPVDTVTESRPNSRIGQSLFGALNTQLSQDDNKTIIFKPSYRYFTDDWGIDSHTLETRFVVEFGDGKEFEPYFRYYTQTSADFYRAQIPSGETRPTHLSSDYRMSEFGAITLGAIYRWKAGTKTYRIGLDIYDQSPATPKDQLAGQADLNPGVQAFMLRFGISF